MTSISSPRNSRHFCDCRFLFQKQATLKVSYRRASILEVLNLREGDKAVCTASRPVRSRNCGSNPHGKRSMMRDTQAPSCVEVKKERKKKKIWMSQHNVNLVIIHIFVRPQTFCTKNLIDAHDLSPKLLNEFSIKFCNGVEIKNMSMALNFG